jgi:DNA-binding transcriptional LysR family regulator
MTSATTIRIAATANVVRIPMATAAGSAVVMSIVADASANTAPMTDAPVISLLWHPRLDADPAHRWLRGCVRDICADMR